MWTQIATQREQVAQCPWLVKKNGRNLIEQGTHMKDLRGNKGWVTGLVPQCSCHFWVCLLCLCLFPSLCLIPSSCSLSSLSARMKSLLYHQHSCNTLCVEHSKSLTASPRQHLNTAVCMLAHGDIHKHRHTVTCSDTHIHRYTYLHTHTDIHTNIHAYIHIQKEIHSYTQTNSHIYTMPIHT